MVANFQMKIFQSPNDLVDFVHTSDEVAKVINVVTDNSGAYILFYEST